MNESFVCERSAIIEDLHHDILKNEQEQKVSVLHRVSTNLILAAYLFITEQIEEYQAPGQGLEHSTVLGPIAPSEDVKGNTFVQLVAS